MNDSKFGFQSLLRKSLAVITATFSTLSANSTPATIASYEPDRNADSHSEEAHRNVLKPKLVLKLNMANPENSLVLMHTSHRSHSSHSSHYSSSYSSGSSRSSSYYSSPGYSSGSSSSSTKTKGRVKRNKSNYSTSTGFVSSTNVTSASANVKRRTLKRGSTGEDVTRLQELLVNYIAAGDSTGVFGDHTKAAVISFQKAHHLKANGVVGSKTWKVLLKN